MTDFEAKIPTTLEELPTGKVKAWTPPRSPRVITVENDNRGGNPAHRTGTFQVKLHGRTGWEDEQTLEWEEALTYEAGGDDFAIRNRGTVVLNLRYQWPLGVV
ncbi:MAG TPA: hypothetical protein VIJ51_15210 [Solirubrobacteraceae bacterium]|jgi:hypothetical protein